MAIRQLAAIIVSARSWSLTRRWPLFAATLCCRLFTLRWRLPQGNASESLLRYPKYTPMYTVSGLWNREGERWTHWCEGFYPGIFTRTNTLEKFDGPRRQKVTAARWNRPAVMIARSTIWAFSSSQRIYAGIIWTGDEARNGFSSTRAGTLALRRQRGWLSGVLHRAAITVYRHHDECRPCFVGRQRDR